MEGPAFSTVAESNVYRSWGMDVIGMTNLQEAKLAREAEICYVTVAMVTDYDCWHPDHDAVTVTEIIANLTQECRECGQGCRRGGRKHACRTYLQMRFGSEARADHQPRRCPGEDQGRSWSCWLASISTGSASDELLAYCLAGETWPESLLRKALARTTGAICLGLWSSASAIYSSRHSAILMRVCSRK